MSTEEKDIAIINNLFDLVKGQGTQGKWEDKYELFAMRARRRRRRIRTFWSVGSAAITLVIASLYFSFFQHTDPDQLFDTYYSKHEFSIDYRTESNGTSIYKKAIKEYTNGNPEKSAAILDRLIIQHPEDPDYQFLNALNLMEMNQFSQASVIFDQIILAGGSFEILGLWYKGLCFLKRGEIFLAKQQFTKLEKLDDPFYSKQAKKVLGSLHS